MSIVSESLAATTADAIDHAALAETMPLEQIDVSNPKLYQLDVWQPSSFDSIALSRPSDSTRRRQREQGRGVPTNTGGAR
jgi:hypothetical protein